MKNLSLSSLLIIIFFSFFSLKTLAQGTDCSTASPFCTSQSYTFPASTGTQSPVGPNYGCLSTQPNPAFYYLQIDNPGSINIFMQSSANVDIDFICWGPFTSVNAACSSGLTGNSVDCSYSANPTENCNIPNAQTGEVYVLLITNFSNQVTNIEFSQTSGAGSTDCNIINPCIIQTLTASPTACDTLTNTYTLTGQIAFVNAPTSGTLIITDSNGNSDTLSAPFTSPQTYTLSNNTTDGTTHTVTASFSGDTTCYTQVTYNAPANCQVFNPCAIQLITANPSACDTSNNQYTVTGSITFSDPPTAGYLLISNDNGLTDTIFAPFTSPSTYLISGNFSDGAQHTITATFSANNNCNANTIYNAPVVCNNTISPCDIISVSTNVTACDSATNQYTLSGSINLAYPPNTGTLTITDSDGNSQSFNAPFANNIIYSIPNNPNGAQTHNITVSFSSAPTCSYSTTYMAPDVCQCSVTAQTNAPVCVNDTLKLFAVQIHSGFNYAWTGPGGYNSSQQNPIITPVAMNDTGNYTIIIYTGFCSDTDNVHVSIFPEPTVTITSINPNTAVSAFHYCHQDSLRLVALPSNHTSYMWSHGENNDTTRLLASSPIPYSVTITDINGCKKTTSQEIKSSDPQVDITGEQIFCEGDSILLTAIATPSTLTYSYYWPIQNANTQSIYIKGGIYKVKATDQFGCYDTDSIMFNSSPIPIANFGWGPIPSFKNEAVNFMDSSIVASGSVSTWNWEFISMANTSGLQNPAYTFSDTGLFNVNLTVTSNNGCVDSVKRQIRIIDYVNEVNVFTPNNDSHNDIFSFLFLNYFKENHLVIYDRWGRKVFEQDNYKNDWKGDDLPSGTYYYILTVPDNKKQPTIKGTVTIIK